MGVADSLGYRLIQPGGVRRMVVSLASTRPMSALIRRVLPPADRLVLRLTDGRSTFTSLLTGLATVWLTATGAKSGQPRTVPLLGIPIGDDVAVLGTSFGQASTPSWVHNLETHPNAMLSYRTRTVPITARRARPDEAEQVWRMATKLYPGYGKYSDWAAHRDIRVFLLELREIDSGDARVGS